MAYMPLRRARVNSESTLPLFDWADRRSIIIACPQATILQNRLMRGRGYSRPLAKAVIAAWALGGRENG